MVVAGERSIFSQTVMISPPRPNVGAQAQRCDKRNRQSVLFHRWIHKCNINISSGAVYTWIWPHVGKLNARSSAVFASQHVSAVISDTTGHRSSGSAQMLSCKTEPRAAAKCKATKTSAGAAVRLLAKELLKTDKNIHLPLMSRMDVYKHEANKMI